MNARTLSLGGLAVAVLVVRAVEPERPRVVAVPAAIVGILVAAALAIGRHDEVVVALTRWST